MVWSYLFILPVPRSIKKPDQNNMFHNDFGLNCDSMTNGVFLYPSFLAMIILSESFFLLLGKCWECREESQHDE